MLCVNAVVVIELQVDKGPNSLLGGKMSSLHYFLRVLFLYGGMVHTLLSALSLKEINGSDSISLGFKIV